MFLAPKTKYCLTINKHGIIQEHKTFSGFSNSKKLLHRSHYFKRIEGEIISALLPKSWKKSFNSGMNKPTKMRFCDECIDKRLCNKCNTQPNENKKFEANLSFKKIQAPNPCGHMLPFYKV